MEINEIFSKNLVRLRKSKGFSQRELAKKTNLTQRIINYYENKPKSIPVEKLRTLAKALDITIADLFSDEETHPLDKLDVRWIKKIKQLRLLSESDQREINRHINYLLEKMRFGEQQSNSITSRSRYSSGS